MKESSIIYFCPTCSGDQDELSSIEEIVSILKSEKIEVDLSPSWADLMIKLQDDSRKNLLIVFRLDFLERKDMMLDEVLSMLASLTKFVGNSIDINIAVIVLRKCEEELIQKLKRNNVLGVIPGIRKFSKEHSITAYNRLKLGFPHWPIIVMSDNEFKIKDISLTDRQYEIFNLVARRGLSNKKIAEMLAISEDTVKFHVGTIFKKYGVRNRTQLALACDTGTLYYH